MKCVWQPIFLQMLHILKISEQIYRFKKWFNKTTKAESYFKKIWINFKLLFWHEKIRKSYKFCSYKFTQKSYIHIFKIDFLILKNFMLKKCSNKFSLQNFSELNKCWIVAPLQKIFSYLTPVVNFRISSKYLNKIQIKILPAERFGFWMRTCLIFRKTWNSETQVNVCNFRNFYVRFVSWRTFIHISILRIFDLRTFANFKSKFLFRKQSFVISTEFECLIFDFSLKINVSIGTGQFLK